MMEAWQASGQFFVPRVPGIQPTVPERVEAEPGDLKLLVFGGVEGAIEPVGGVGRRSDREPTKNCAIVVTSGRAFTREVTFLGSAIL